MRLLGVDLGDKRTGLAVGDTDSRMASPIGLLEIPRRDTDRLAGAIADAAREQEAAGIVLGLPLNMDDTAGPRAVMARAFAETLAAASGLPVHLHDERLTSAAADWSMAGSGLTHKQKKARRDSLAAAAMLQDYLAAAPDSPRADAPPRSGSS